MANPLFYVADVRSSTPARPQLFGVAALLLLAGILLLPATSRAAAQLMVSPTRIVFSPHERSAQVNLINNGNEAGTFRISFERKQMTEQGGFEDIGPNTPGMFSDPYIRYSPRQVTLAPGQSQVVRLLLRRPADLAGGEYRSHMLFQTIPENSATRIESQVHDAKGGISVSMIPLLGISIPVIFRVGETHSAVTLDNLHLSAGPKSTEPKLSLQFHRTGNSSVYGDILVKYHPSSGDELMLGIAKGLAVYTSNAVRDFTMSLQLPDDLKLQDGNLVVEYKQPEDQGGKVLATAQLALPASGH